jgi:hypothetical protein
MATWEDIRRLAMAMPETTETSDHGHTAGLAWRVKDKTFVWERPLRKSDLAALGADAPTGEILGARVEHEGAKLALIESDPALYFTIPHFNGFAAVLVKLELIDTAELEALIVDAWLSRAPKRLAAQYIEAHGS